MAESATTSVLKLPAECNPPSDSDDDSFVVLEEESLCTIHASLEPLNAAILQESLNAIAEQKASLQENGPDKLASISSEIGLDDVQSKVASLVEENMRLKETLAQNNSAIKKQMETICVWQLEMHKVHQSHKEKFAETKQYIDNLKKENMNLKECLKEAESKIVVLSHELESSKREEGGIAIDTFSLLKSSFDNLTEFELQAAQKKICGLEGDIAKLQLSTNDNLFDAKQNIIDDLQQQLQEKHQQCERLQRELQQQQREAALNQEKFWKDIELLKKRQAENVRNENFQETLHNIRQQLMHAQETITNLQREKGVDNDVIKTKNQEIAELQQHCSEMSKELETIPVLKMQLDVYKSDFEAEKSAKLSIKSEKEKITEDLSLIHRRNQQLLDEVEHLRLNSNAPYRAAASRAPTSSYVPAAPKEEYACPRCGFRFKNLQALENHVYRCIELDSLP